MPSEETLRLATYYLQKHYTPDNIVGMGPFLETGNYALLASPNAMLGGSMIFSMLGDGYVDCRIVAQKLYLDILSEHPELDPRIITYKGRIQNFVEITDPATGEKVQIDPTPWYNCLNPGLSGDDTSELHNVDFLVINKTQPPIFSVKRTEDSVTTMGITGFLPQVSMEEKLAGCRRAIEAQKRTATGSKNLIIYPEPKVEPKAEYRFIFQVESRPVVWPAGKPSPRLAHFYINVLNSELLQSALKSGVASARNLDFLIQSEVIEVGVSPEDVNISMPSIAFMKELAGRMNDQDLFAEFERNIPAILKLLSLAKPVLPVYKQKGEVVNVKGGIIHMPILEPGHDPKIKNLFDDGKYFDSGKYRGILRLLEDKTPPKIGSGLKPMRLKVG